VGRKDFWPDIRLSANRTLLKDEWGSRRSVAKIRPLDLLVAVVLTLVIFLLAARRLTPAAQYVWRCIDIR